MPFGMIVCTKWQVTKVGLLNSEFESLRHAPTEEAQAVNGVFKAPEGAVLTSINTETGSFTLSFLQVQIDDECYMLSQLRQFLK